MRTVLLAAAFAIATALAPASRAETVLRIARIENIPDQYVGGEILKEVYRRLDIRIELVDVPAQRALVDSSQGELDGEVQRNINVRRQYPTLLMLQPAINYIEPSVFSMNLRFDVRGWDSIRDYRIGIVRGVGTSEDGTRGMPSVLAVTNIDQLMQTLAAGRVDVAVSDAFSGLAVLKRLGLEDRIALLTPRLQRNDIYHFLHEKHRDLVPRVERVLRSMQASGELESLRRKFVGQYLSHLGGTPAGK